MNVHASVSVRNFVYIISLCGCLLTHMFVCMYAQICAYVSANVHMCVHAV